MQRGRTIAAASVLTCGAALFTLGPGLEVFSLLVIGWYTAPVAQLLGTVLWFVGLTLLPVPWRLRGLYLALSVFLGAALWLGVVLVWFFVSMDLHGFEGVQ
jgi:hypothetical protein